MNKKILAIITSLMIPAAMQINSLSCYAADTGSFAFSSYINDKCLQKCEASEVDNSLFDKFLKYSLLVTDKDSLSAEELELCHKIFETERAYMPYITCPYARETIKNGIAPPRISTDDKAILACMADETTSRTAEYYAYYPDIFYYNYYDHFGEFGNEEYWLDSSGRERITTGIINGPCYEITYDEKPDYDELDRVTVLCWGGGDLIECDDGSSYMYSGNIMGSRYKDYLYGDVFTSDIWQYELMSDDSAVIVGCTLPKYSNAESIDETLILPAELDGHAVSGIIAALSGTGISKLVIPENYKFVSNLAGMEYLKEIEINSPDLTLKFPCFTSCPELETAILNVKSVESNAFYGCKELKSLEINGAEGIACDAFSNLSSLSDVTLPENLRYIGQDAFTNTAVSELVIPKNVEIVGALKNPYVYMNELIDPLTADCIMIADEDCVIKSYYDTEAHSYAIANGYNFSPLDNIQYGDVSDDGEFDISDVVLLQRWLVGAADAQLKNWKAADFYADGKLDTYDLCLMKRQLVNSTARSPLDILIGMDRKTAVSNAYISKSEYNHQITGNLKCTIEEKMERPLDYSIDRFYLVNNEKIGLDSNTKYLYNAATTDIYVVNEETKMNYATWYWKGSKAALYGIDDDEEKQNEFLDAMEFYGITEIYYSIGANKLVNSKDMVEMFVKNAYKRDMKVYLLNGENTWLYEDSYQKAIYNIFNKVEEYNSLVDHDARLAGVSYDAEVWINSEYDWKNNNAARYQQVKFIETAQQYAESKNLSVSYCLPFWIVQYDYTDEDGVTRNIYDSITQISNETILMVYRDSADAVLQLVTGVQNNAENSVFYYVEKNDCNLEIAVETNESTEGDHVTFYEEEKDAPGYVTAAIADMKRELEAYKYRTTFAIHHAIVMYEYYLSIN